MDKEVVFPVFSDSNEEEMGEENGDIVLQIDRVEKSIRKLVPEGKFEIVMRDIENIAKKNLSNNVIKHFSDLIENSKIVNIEK